MLVNDSSLGGVVKEFAPGQILHGGCCKKLFAMKRLWNKISQGAVCSQLDCCYNAATEKKQAHNSMSQLHLICSCSLSNQLKKRVTNTTSATELCSAPQQQVGIACRSKFMVIRMFVMSMSQFFVCPDYLSARASRVFARSKCSRLIWRLPASYHSPSRECYVVNRRSARIGSFVSSGVGQIESDVWQPSTRVHLRFSSFAWIF